MGNEPRYTIAEVAAITGMPATTIRYYESEGLLMKVERQSGIRKFSDDDIAWLNLIVGYIRAGLSLAELKQLIAKGQGEPRTELRLNILESRKAKILKQQEELSAVLERLEQKIEHFTKPDLACGNCENRNYRP